MDADYIFSKKIGNAELKIQCKRNGYIELRKETQNYQYQIPLDKEELNIFESMLAVWRHMEKIRIEEQDRAAQAQSIKEGKADVQ